MSVREGCCRDDRETAVRGFDLFGAAKTCHRKHVATPGKPAFRLRKSLRGVDASWWGAGDPSQPFLVSARFVCYSHALVAVAYFDTPEGVVES